MLKKYSSTEMAAIDADIEDLRMQLETGFEVGVSQVLMMERPPASLVEVGKRVQTWIVNDQPAEVMELETTMGKAYAFEVSDGVAVKHELGANPEDAIMGMSDRDSITTAQKAARRYPVALGLFLMLDKAGLTDRVLGVSHFGTGIDEQKQAGSGAAAEGAGLSTTPSEHFVVALSDSDALATVGFNSKEITLMGPRGGPKLFDKPQVLPMATLLAEEKARQARLSRSG